MKKGSKIYIAGHTGMLGTAITKLLLSEGYINLTDRTSSALDLRKQADVEAFFEFEKPEYVFLAAAKVGGILANIEFGAEFLYDNLAIATNVIHQSYRQKVKKLLYISSAAVYPKMAKQPLKECDVLSGALEETIEPYGLAKIAGIKLCEQYRKQYDCNFVSVIPSNLYGPDAKDDLKTSHVISALIRKFHDGKIHQKPFVEVWGSGKARREFTSVDDLADACLFVMLHYNEMEPLNVGTGKDISIGELADLIREVTSYSGEIKWDLSKPEGISAKVMDISRLSALNWKARVDLKQGIQSLYSSFLRNQN